MENKGRRDLSIDILKCFAAIIITNSHMEILYHPYDFLATGGAIGDALFFFSSGYTLFLGRGGNFFNWYKRRINRIYPTIFSWTLIASVLCLGHWHERNIFDVVISGGGWFVSCIMFYYALLWFIRRYAMDKFIIITSIWTCIILIWFFVFGLEEHSNNNIYGFTYFKWCHFFLFMLLGAIMGRKVANGKKHTSFISCIIKLSLCVIGFYGFFYFKKYNNILCYIQLLSLIPLIGICYYFFLLCNTKKLMIVLNHKIYGAIIKFIGSLCLEIYLVQYSLFTNKMNSIFPLNLIIMFFIIIIAAYILRCIARFWSQTFKDEDYNWSSIIKLY